MNGGVSEGGVRTMGGRDGKIVWMKCEASRVEGRGRRG